MAILIKGMEMPTSCYRCPFCDYVSARCDAVRGTPYTPASRYEERADFCPLVPVPEPHGKLGDLDELKTAFPCGENIRTESVRATIEHLPTVIPASEEG